MLAEVRMKLTMSSEMGIHAVWFLAAANRKEPVLSAEIAGGICVSETYLIKVLKRLVRGKILGSRKGKKGGYVLKKKAADISLADVVSSCEDTGAIYECSTETRGCVEQSVFCPVRAALARAQQAMITELQRTSIADLMSSDWGGTRTPTLQDAPSASTVPPEATN
jgi:Rrf2 family protein